MSYKLLQINQLSGIDVLGGNYNSYTMYKNDMLIASVGSQTGSLSTVKLTLDDVTNGIYASFNTNAPILCAGLTTARRVYFPEQYSVAIGREFPSSTPDAKLTVVGTISSNGAATLGDGATGLTVTGDIIVPDNDIIKIGAGNDLQLYHDGSHSYIQDSGTGMLRLLGSDMRLSNGNNTADYIAMADGGAVNVSHNGSVKLATKSDGVDITGELQSDTLDVDGASQLDGTLTVGVDDTGYDVKLFGATSGKYMLWDESADSLLFPDSTYLRLGSSQDLSIYHSGSHGYAVNITGDYIIQNEANDKDITLKTDDGSGGVTTYINCDGSETDVKLNFGGSTKLTTKTDGVDITGELQSDTLDVDGAADISGNLAVGGTGTVTSNLTVNGNLVGAANVVNGLSIVANGTANVTNQAGTTMNRYSLSGLHGTAKAHCVYTPQGAGGFYSRYNVANAQTRENVTASDRSSSGYRNLWGLYTIYMETNTANANTNSGYNNCSIITLRGTPGPGGEGDLYELDVSASIYNQGVKSSGTYDGYQFVQIEILRAYRAGTTQDGRSYYRYGGDNLGTTAIHFVLFESGAIS